MEWIICERTSRWASALRMAIAFASVPCRLWETRRLAELDAELAGRPTCLTALEIHRGNFAEVLNWLPNAQQRVAHVRFVALLDRTLAEDSEVVCDALVEAGAQAIASSPRRLEGLLDLARQHAAIPQIADENMPLTARVWASLPWQER